jgi:CBS domain containing-hemolysin-like protein
MLGRAPESGDRVHHDGLHFEVLETDGSRIERIQVEFVPLPSGESEEPQPVEG